jgi:hypothetical protein
MSDWIKVRRSLRDDPCVLSIASNLKVSIAEIIGCLVFLLMLADDFTRDGKIPWLTGRLLDSHVGIKGFSEQLIKYDCIFFCERGAELLRFYEPHNTKVQT